MHRRLWPTVVWVNGIWRLAPAAAVSVLALLGAAAAQARPTPEDHPAAAQDRQREQRARALYAEAERHFAAQRYRRAIKRYTEAYELWPLPGFLFNIAQCHRLLGDFEQAVAYFERYIGRYPDSPHRAQIERLLAELRPRALRQRAARRAAMSALRGSGNERGKKGNNADAPVPRAASRPTPGTRGGEINSFSEPRTAGLSVSRSRPVLLWSGIGLAAALVTAGLVTGQLASNKVQRYNDRETPAADRPQLKDSAETLRTASIVTFSAAGAAALATTLYYWLGGSSAGARASRVARGAISAAPWGSGGAVTIHGHY